jgi:hypothetical protein
LLTGRNVRTKKEPIQPIPLFEELIDLLMEDENKHVSLNVSLLQVVIFQKLI